MTSIMQRISDGFWNEHVWLPPNTTWNDIAPGSSNEIQFANPKHLYIPIPLAFLMLGLRYCLEKYWFAPVGISLGIKNCKPRKARRNAVLEKAYTSNGKLNYKQIQGFAKQLDWTEREVERWLRVRRNQDKPSKLVKFCENAWRFSYYLSISIYGIIILWDKPWLWDINECWYTYPYQSVGDDIWWYYILSLAFYWSLCISQFFDVKRNDFWEMFAHHIATIVLMSFSWVTNTHRIGSLVLITHDCADIFLEMAKMAKYSGYQRVCDTLFVVFMVMWFITRLGVFPFWIVYNISIEAPKIVPMFPAYYIFNGLLAVLLGLHVFWTYLILKVALRTLKAGQMECDVRSSSSYFSEDSK